MPLRSLTPEERAAAIAKANAQHERRAEVLGALRAGERRLADVLTPEPDELLGKVKLVDLLLAVPGQNRASVEALLTRLDVGDACRLRSVTDEQRQIILDAVG